MTSLLDASGDTPTTVDETTSTLRQRVIIDRPVFDQASFDYAFDNGDRGDGNGNDVIKPDTVCRRFKQAIRKRSRSGSKPSIKCLSRGIASKATQLLPVLKHLRVYQWRQWLIKDIVAGICSGVVHVPQGMGFAMLANLPPVYGLYSSIFPGWIYYVFGTSRHLSMGTMALTALMVGAVVKRELADMKQLPRGDLISSHVTTAGPDSDHVTTAAWTASYSDVTDSALGGNDTLLDEGDDAAFKVGVAMSVTMMAGLFQLLMYVCRLGVLASYMSSPFVSGFMTGSAIQIMTSQIPFQLGVKIKRPSGSFVVPLTLYEVCRNLPSANVAAVITSLITVAFLIIVKEGINDKFASKMKMPVPAELIVVIIATMVSYFATLHDRFGVAVIGVIPTGLPKPRIPPFNGNPTDYVTDGVLLAIVAFAVSISMAKLMAEKHRYQIDVGQEILANGLQNALSSLLGCFVSTQAPPRTLIHDTAGCMTQLAGFISTLVPLLVAVAIGPLFEPLPVPVLGSIVSVALVPLLRQAPANVRRLWAVDRFDLVVWITACLVTALVSITAGLGCGIGLSIFLIIIEGQLATGNRLIAAGQSEIYRATTKHISATATNRQQECSESIDGGNEECGIRTSSTHDADKANEKDPVSNDSVIVFRFPASIYFANVERFREQLYQATGDPRILLKREQKLKSKLEEKQKQNNHCSGKLMKCCTTGQRSAGRQYDRADDNRSRRGRQEKEPMEKEDADYQLFTLSNGNYVDKQQETPEEVDKTSTDINDVELSGVSPRGVPHQSAIVNCAGTESPGDKKSLYYQMCKGIAPADVENGNLPKGKNQLSGPVRTVVIDCSSINHVDSTGLATIKQISTEYSSVGTELALACCSSQLLKKFNAVGIKYYQQAQQTTEVMSAKAPNKQAISFYPTVHDAVLASRNRSTIN